MKRKIVMFIIMLVFFLLETAVLPMITILSAVPNLLLIFTAAMGFMQGKKEGMMVGFTAGLLIDLSYESVFGVNALIFLCIGYVSGCFADIYFDEDVKIPLLLVTGGDLFLNIIVYIREFLLRGKLNLGGYLMQVIIPEIVSTVIFTLLLYRLLYLINHSMVEKEKKGKRSLWIRD